MVSSDLPRIMKLLLLSNVHPVKKDKKKPIHKNSLRKASKALVSRLSDVAVSQGDTLHVVVFPSADSYEPASVAVDLQSTFNTVRPHKALHPLRNPTLQKRSDGRRLMVTGQLVLSVLHHPEAFASGCVD